MEKVVSDERACEGAVCSWITSIQNPITGELMSQVNAYVNAIVKNARSDATPNTTLVSANVVRKRLEHCATHYDDKEHYSDGI